MLCRFPAYFSGTGLSLGSTINISKYLSLQESLAAGGGRLYKTFWKSRKLISPSGLTVAAGSHLNSRVASPASARQMELIKVIVLEGYYVR